MALNTHDFEYRTMSSLVQKKAEEDTDKLTKMSEVVDSKKTNEVYI